MAVVTWPRLRKHLQEKLETARNNLDTAADSAEFYRFQGEVRTLKALLNLPETLAMLDQEDERVAQAAKERT